MHINHHLDKSSNIMNDFKGPLDSLSANLDGLNGHTMQIALLGEVGTKQEIAGLREQMRTQDQKHKEGIIEIQSILNDFLQNQVVENMRIQVEKEITKTIDDLVKEHVAECLKDHIPLELQEEVADSKRELEELNLALYNSESRRANGNLRANKPDDFLANLLMPNGMINPLFPGDLKQLFSLDAATVKTLMKDYGLPDISETNKDHNLNRFMQFCGVRYQLVHRTAAPAAASEKQKKQKI